MLICGWQSWLRGELREHYASSTHLDFLSQWDKLWSSTGPPTKMIQVESRRTFAHGFVLTEADLRRIVESVS